MALIENSRLSKFIDDPHQKFYYIYNFEKPYEFHVQLIKILDNDPTKEFPSLFKAIGEAPKIFVPFIAPDDDYIAGDDDDLVDDDDVVLADEGELDGLNTDTESEDEGDEESNDDDFAGEFSDSEDYDDRD